MKTLRNTLCALLCACLLSVSAMAEAPSTSSDKWAKGAVRASETLHMYAPMGGQLDAFDLTLGDDLKQGATLMQVRPLDVTAPYDGVIRIQHARVGDLAEGVIASYGALCYLERQDVQWLETSTSTAYDDAKNRDIRVGEELRVYNNKSSSKDKHEALGRVVSVTGTDFVVEFPSNLFDAEESIRVYRGTGDEYKDKDVVGKGKAKRVPPIAIAANGVVADVLIEEGQTVSRGQPLYALDEASARYETTAERVVSAPQDCALTSLLVQGGQHVVKGQLLLTATPLTNLECVVDVDELDVSALSVGQIILVKLDARPDAPLTATLDSIAPLGKEVLDTTKYEVTLKFATGVEGLRPGMHVTAYWD